MNVTWMLRPTIDLEVDKYFFPHAPAAALELDMSEGLLNNELRTIHLLFAPFPPLEALI